MATAALYFASKAFRLESRREARWEQAQRAQQASLVAAWLTGEPRKPGVYLHNASPLPVFDMVVEFDTPEEWVAAHPELSQKAHPKALTTFISWRLRVPRVTLPVLTPTQQPLFQAVDMSRMPLSEIEIRNHPPKVHSTRFRDAAGVRWERTASGELREVR